MDEWELNDDNYWSDTGNEINTNTYADTPSDNYWGTINNNQSYSNPAASYGNWATPSEDTSLNTGWFDLSNPSYNYTQQTNPLGAVSGVLNDLFTKGTTANSLGQLGTALMSGYQNKQKAANASKIASQVDPWASQRSYYQTQAQNAVTDPYSSPIVSAQIKQMQAIQDRKDAAAGRRSNSLIGNTAVMGEAAKIAQAYQQQMANQGGANINPSGLANVLQSGYNADTSGYASPIAALFGKNMDETTISNLLKTLSKR